MAKDVYIDGAKTRDIVSIDWLSGAYEVLVRDEDGKAVIAPDGESLASDIRFARREIRATYDREQ